MFCVFRGTVVVPVWSQTDILGRYADFKEHRDNCSLQTNILSKSQSEIYSCPVFFFFFASPENTFFGLLAASAIRSMLGLHR